MSDEASPHDAGRHDAGRHDAGRHDAVERAARDAYGRLLGRLASRTRDIAAAEDALADAFVAALTRWPIDGVPDAPEAWLLTTAKRRWLDRTRRVKVRSDEATLAALRILQEEASDPLGEEPRLALMFVCAHPAIDESIRVPLMLQTVLGLEAREIAAALVVSPTTMAQRLVRAKQKIRDAGIPFEVPEPRERGERLPLVLDALYGLFAAGWLEGDERALEADAGALAALLADAMPEEPEVLGLVSLIELSRARSAARVADDGCFVPLAQQDVARWDRDAIVRAEARLSRAAAMRRPGPLQLEAALQSAHASRLFTGITPWNAIVFLHRTLDASAPTLATKLAFAASLLEIDALDDARAILGTIEASFEAARLEAHQPLWVVRAELARRGGDTVTERACLDRALALTTHESVRRYLQRKRDAA